VTSIGDEAQLQIIADRIGKAAATIAIREFVQTHPHFEAPPAPKPETPTYVKWGAGIGATLVAAAILWMANTLNQLQLTVARIDERQITDTTKADVRDLQRRVTALEQGAAQ
jgi:hypothetical protein